MPMQHWVDWQLGKVLKKYITWLFFKPNKAKLT